MLTKVYKKLLIVPGYTCNNRCLFCINSEMRSMPERSTAEIVKLLKKGLDEKYDYLEFAGGEDAIRPDFCLLVKTARKMGYERVTIATNGRIFSYIDFAKKVFDAGITDIIFSVHAPNEYLHDTLTKVQGSFRQAILGLENMLKLFSGTDRTIATNTAITKLNYKVLPETGKFIMSFGLHNSEFIFADPTRGGVADNFDMLMPKISLAAPYIRECLALGRGYFQKSLVKNLLSNWAIRYVPLCYFTDFFPFQISDVRESIVFSQVSHSKPDGETKDYVQERRLTTRSKTERCKDCLLRDDCEGIWNKYLQAFGDEEFIPVTDKTIPLKKVKYIKDFLSCR